VAKNKKHIITKEQLDQIEKGKIRQDQKEQGFFDGRFVSRSEESKKLYKRHKKHKNRDGNY
jgi:hypothetical protein